MNTFDTIKELLDELGCGQVTFTRAMKDPNSVPVPAVLVQQSIQDEPGMPSVMIKYEKIRPTYEAALNEVLEQARKAHKHLAPKTKTVSPNNVVALQ